MKKNKIRMRNIAALSATPFILLLTLFVNTLSICAAPIYKGDVFQYKLKAISYVKYDSDLDELGDVVVNADDEDSLFYDSNYGFTMYSFVNGNTNYIDTFDVEFRQSFFDFQPMAYDYYFYVTMYSYTLPENFTFRPDNCIEIEEGETGYELDDVVILDHSRYHDGGRFTGFTAYAKIPEDYVCASYLESFLLQPEEPGTMFGNPLYLTFDIIKVEKGTSAEEVSASINTKLDAILKAIEAMHEELSSLLEDLNETANYLYYTADNIESNTVDIIDLLDKLYEQSEKQHNQNQTGYDNEQLADANVTLNDTLTGFSTKTDSLTDSAYMNMQSYTITDNITSLAKGLVIAVPLVSTMLQSMYESADGFTILISTAFTVTVVCMCIGIYRFYRKGD